MPLDSGCRDYFLETDVPVADLLRSSALEESIRAELRGLSQALIESHWANNYGSAVKTLNAVKTKLSALLADARAPPFLYNSLKREHLLRSGSVVLHDLYFEGMGGDGRADAAMRALIAGSFGTFDAWETEFRRIATGLGGGSGWVVLGYNTHFGTLENYWLADHMHFPAGAVPLLVLDMYEHAYQIDYGAVCSARRPVQGIPGGSLHAPSSTRPAAAVPGARAARRRPACAAAAPPSHRDPPGGCAHRAGHHP